MISQVFDFLSKELSSYLKAKLSAGNNEQPAMIAYPTLDTDPLSFKTGAINFLLVNIEEEKLLRSADPYLQLDQQGIKNMVSPPLRLDLYVLFAAKFSDYSTALKQLSYVIRFFQKNKVFTPESFPMLPEHFSKMIVELQTLSHGQKNEIWGSLKIAYLPSVVYKISMVVFQDEIISMDKGIEEIQKNTNIK